ncbi:MmgE/PrpD family protein [Pseudomonas sp. StFLB209]|uniref:MmgE/PrpD family protein n=1 Tax=Pseudomonas sp. StFLB209 TaxID=1028989 RepID=UPI0004F6481C|nr:MmgE/PrpD family protein [Pseudomonas sp. StFLB209]BAP43822.1 MmgE/PrpD family protein [Pseudomonas sp. StFLB209]
MTLTTTLARFACQLQLSDVPPTLVTKLKLHVLDALGCGWAASGTGLGDQARALARASGGLGQCQVFAGSSDYSPAAAAFANAFIINALDHDDGVEIDGKGMGHPGSSLVAAAMAALDSHPGAISEADLLAALAAGFEINNRLINALQPSAESFAKAYGVAQHQAIGAAVVYARACGFDEQQMHHTLGFAATLACVPSLHKYNWQQRPIVTLKDGVAPAAQAGVQAALMARAGLAGSQDVLDGPQGYWRMIGSDRFAERDLIEGLGCDWYLRFGSFKRYPACRWLATALECAQQLIRTSGWAPEDIAQINVRTFARLCDDFMVYAPASATDAQFSLPYTLAATLMQLPATDWYSEANLHSSELRALAAKVHADVDPELDARWLSADRQPGAQVTLVHSNGETIQAAQATPYGSEKRPMADMEVIAKAQANLLGRVREPERFIRNLLASGSDANYPAGSGQWMGCTET